MTTRREPILWLQLLAIGFIPMELLLLRLVLAGSDPGPIVALERVLTWSIAVIAPSIALWRTPADWGSLLLISLARNGRTKEQEKIGYLQSKFVNRIGLLVGNIGLLVSLWWLDQSSVLVKGFSPTLGLPRLAILLISIPLLALMLWQWQQLIQSLWLLSRSEKDLDSAHESSDQILAKDRICLGLGLLKFSPLELSKDLSKSPKENFKKVDPASVQHKPQEISEELIREEGLFLERDELSETEVDSSVQDSTEWSDSSVDTSISDDLSHQEDVEEDLVDCEAAELVNDELEALEEKESEPADQSDLPLSGAVEPEQDGEEQQSTNLDS